MQNLVIKARAKINLTLDILGKRADGYHNVEMIMQSVALHDTITIKKGDQGIEITGDATKIPLTKENLVYKAVEAIFRRTKQNLGCQIDIKKEIPVAAGLAGGSTDAAAALTGLNQFFKLGLTQAELMELGATIGSDIPFCIMGGTALAYGRGELIKPLPPMPKLWVVMAKPDIGVSTAEIYQNYDAARVVEKPNTDLMVKTVVAGDVEQIKHNLINVLESVTMARYPQVKEIKELMVRLGVKSTLMSGSGPTVFGLTNTEQEAQSMASKMKDFVPIVIVTYTM